MVAFAFLCAGLVLTRGEGKFTFIRFSLFDINFLTRGRA